MPTESWAPVVADDRLAGILSARDVVAAYRRALAANVRQVRAVGSTGALVEAEIGPSSALAGQAVAATAWPRDTVLVSIARGDRVIVPRGDVRLEVGDRLTVFSAPTARSELESLLAAEVKTRSGGMTAPRRSSASSARQAYGKARSTTSPSSSCEARSPSRSVPTR